MNTLGRGAAAASPPAQKTVPTGGALPPRLRTLQGGARACALQFRGHGLALDRNPGDVAPLLSLEGVRWLSRLLVPREYNPSPLRIGNHVFDGMDCLERVVALEELAYGDAGIVFASPGGSMAGIAVADLGGTEQKQAYAERVLAAPTWTFFALTEPRKGSDAAGLETTLRPDGAGLRLDGSKRYIGNGARAALGVVFARTRPGPLGIDAVLIDTGTDGFAAQPLEMIGLRGAQITQMRLDNIAVSPDQVLGQALPATRRGLWGAVMTFNRLRPGIAATALGVARAAHDYVLAHRLRLSPADRLTLDELAGQLAGTRHLIWRAAVEVQANPARGELASAAKAHAVRLAERVTVTATALLGGGSAFDHPLVEKWSRDARAFEFMEGTTIMQKLNVFAGASKGRFRRV